MRLTYVGCLALGLSLLCHCAPISASPSSTTSPKQSPSVARAIANEGASEVASGPALEPARFVRVPLGEQTTLLLLDAESAAAQIGTRDPFLRGLTQLDRQVRMGKVSDVDEAAFVAYAQSQVRAFEPAQIEKLTKVAAEVGALLQTRGLARWLPREIKIVQTTGSEEGFAPEFDLSYTRDGVIYVNTRALQIFSRQLLLHELFHVLAAAHQALREALYAAIGFTRIATPRFPEEMNALRLSLPEVPEAAAHAISVRFAGESVRAVPVTIARVPYTGGAMIDVATSRWAILDTQGSVRLLAELTELEQLLEQVGLNTSGLSGPEEILAENFALLVIGEPAPRSPEVLERMRAILNAP